MAAIERILLYSLVVVVIAGLLIPAGPPPSAVVPSRDVPPDAAEAERSPVADSSAPNAAHVPERRTASPDVSSRGALSVFDPEGRARIEMFVDELGAPRIAMRDATGQDRLTLTLSDSGDATLALGGGVRNLRLTARVDGSNSIRLPSGDGEIVVESDAAGRGEFRLTSPGKSEVALRADSDGSLQMTAGPQGGGRGVEIDWTADGQATLSVRGDPAHPGPFLVAYPDGLSEVSLRSPEDQAGPALIRLPDGVSILSVRDGAGNPAASMVSSPDGSAVVAAQSSSGATRAELRVNPDGVPTIGIVDKPPGPDELPQAPPQKKPPARPVPPPRRAAMR